MVKLCLPKVEAKKGKSPTMPATKPHSPSTTSPPVASPTNITPIAAAAPLVARPIPFQIMSNPFKSDNGDYDYLQRPNPRLLLQRQRLPQQNRSRNLLSQYINVAIDGRLLIQIMTFVELCSQEESLLLDFSEKAVVFIFFSCSTVIQTLRCQRSFTTLS